MSDEKSYLEELEQLEYQLLVDEHLYKQWMQDRIERTIGMKMSINQNDDNAYEESRHRGNDSQGCEHPQDENGDTEVSE
tara:strand:+ start:454 stop:690 length:237 start_codon:yes stop_codon:yes gene_type:complete